MVKKDDVIRIPTIQLVSDSAGWTGQMVGRAAAAQFGDYEPTFDLLTGVTSMEEISTFLQAQASYYKHAFGIKKLTVFYSIVNPELCSRMKGYLEEHRKFEGVDLMSRAIEAIAATSGLSPVSQKGLLHTVNDAYFRRIDALDFTIAHDGGAKPKDLPKADVVILGLSGTGKTPVSIFLSQQGLRVANVEIDFSGGMPKQLADVQPNRMFGLMTTPEVLLALRKGSSKSRAEGKKGYVQLDQVTEDLERSRRTMRQLGCIVIHTENRTAEETAQEILGYYMLTHPRESMA